MLTSHTLNTIQSGTDEEVYRTVTETALYIAAGGYLEHANDLLAALWRLDRPDPRITWLPDIAFTLLWHAAGKHPDRIPFELQDIDTIEINMRGYMAVDKWRGKMPDKPWTELTGQELLRQALINASLDRSGALPAPEYELASITLLKKMGEGGYYDYEGLALGAELAAKHGQTDLAIQFARTCVKKDPATATSASTAAATATATPTTAASRCLDLLASGRHVAPLLLQKIIAPELGLTDTVVEEYLPEIIRTLDNRMAYGRTLVYSHLSWKELLEKISEIAIKVQSDPYEPEVYQSGWIGYDGATIAAIEQTERKLGITLPQDYKDFLAVTNGIRAFSTVDPTLLPVEEIDYLKTVYDSWSFDSLLEYQQVEGDADDYKEQLSNAIIISKYGEEQELWLVPEDKERTRWQAWFYGHWVPGVRPHPSFRFYMEDELESLYRLEED